MTNYTFEQRKIIAEYFNELLIDWDADGEEEFRNPFFKFIKNRVDQLKTVTFGDIKNQVGTRFKLPDQAGLIYRIIHNRNDDIDLNLILLEKESYCWDFSKVKDDVIVEVINETETN